MHVRGALGIGEFAKRCGLSVSALRFYDECSLLEPASVDPTTGYRSYDESQVATALLLRDLRALRLPLAAVRDLLVRPAAERHRAVDEQLRVLADDLDAAREVAQRLHHRIDDLEGTMALSVSGPDLARALEHAGVAAGRDEKRPILRGVLFEAKAGSLRVVATDSYRLAVRDLVPREGGTEVFRAVADGEAVRAVAEWVAGQAEVEVRPDGELVLCAGRDERRLPTLSGQYPEYEVLLAAKSSAHIAVARRDDVLDALDALPRAEAARIVFRPGGVDVVVDTETQSIAAEYAGPGIELHVNPQFARDAALAAVGPDLAIEVSDPLKPLVFRSADDGSAVTLVMPIKAA